MACSSVAAPRTFPPMLDLDFVRPRFPALSDNWALFDNAGGTVPLGTVVDSVATYMRECMVQVGASYAQSARAGKAVADGHRAAEKLLGAGHGEVVLGSSSTVLAKWIARGLRETWSEGDEIVVTDLDHETNVGPWRALEETGIVVREWRVREDDLDLHLEDLEPLLGPRTRLVAFTHCSNILGRHTDAARICRMVRSAGALTCVDGVAHAPHRRPDVGAIGCDLYLTSFYKVCGPHVGALFGRHEVLERARSQNHFFVPEDAVPYKFEPGNVNHELVASLPAIPEYLEALDIHHGGAGELAGAWSLVEQHECALVDPLLHFLEEHPRIRILGPVSSEQRAPTVSFVVEGRRSSEIPPLLDERGVAVRFGHFYAYRLIRRLGLLDRDGVVRVSMAHYNSPEEVERLIDGLEAVC